MMERECDNVSGSTVCSNRNGQQGLSMVHGEFWRDRPIYDFWGSNDHPIILNNSPVFPGHGEGPLGLQYLQERIHCTNLKHEIIPNSGHANNISRAGDWFAEIVAKALGK